MRRKSLPLEGSGGGVSVFGSESESVFSSLLSCQERSGISSGLEVGSMAILLDWLLTTLMLNARWPTKPWITGRTKLCWPASMNGEMICWFQKN